MSSLWRENELPNFYEYSVIISSGCSVIFLVIHMVLFITRQVLQCGETRMMSKLRKMKLNKSIHLAMDDHHRKELKKKDKVLCRSLDVLFIFENLSLMLFMFSLVTYLVAAVAFNFINWGYSFGFGIFLIFCVAIHTSRVRRIARDKLLRNYKDVTKRLNEEENENLQLTAMERPKNRKTLIDAGDIDILSPENAHASTMSDLNRERGASIINSPFTNTPPSNSPIPNSPASTTTTDNLIEQQNENEFRYKYEHKGYGNLIKCGEPLEIYFRSIQHGALKGYRLPFFLVWFGVTMVTTFVLSGIFYGTCICDQPLAFNTAFVRYVSGPACPTNTICSVIAMLPEDPSTSMIIKFYSQSFPRVPSIHYTSNTSTTPTTIPCDFYDLNKDLVELETRYVYTCNLINLTPSTTYFFFLTYEIQTIDYQTNRTNVNGTIDYNRVTTVVRFNGVNNRTAKFQTFSNATNQTVSFITGGGQGASMLSQELIKKAAALNPSFISIGGDMNFDNGILACYRRILGGINNIASFAFDSSGTMIPLLTGIGDHESLSYRFGPTNILNYLLFYSHQVNSNHTNRTTYHAHNLGGCSLLVLDSSVYTPHSDQVNFIRSSWKGLNKTKMAMYHGALYPSSRDFDNSISSLGRKYWGPEFDSLQMTMGFENHDRTLKRTNVITNGVVVDNGKKGVVYLGDGNMGVIPRDLVAGDKQKYYLAQASKDSHFWSVRCSLAGGVTAQAIGVSGDVLDSVSRPSQHL
ncbi:CCD1 [Acrasis kona]|uniref:CCD1 n=1 Tax=Acrasis kona TaxID=1008807 RepID=A0AAW2ZFK8_9EUKA